VVGSLRILDTPSLVVKQFQAWWAVGEESTFC
jgi:hypothetical protein